MAHECPDCGSWCYCNGDIDECLTNFDEDVDACGHCDWRDDDLEDSCCPKCFAYYEDCICNS